MEIHYSSKKVKKHCTDFKEAQKYYSQKTAIKLHKLINFIEEIESLKELIDIPIYHFHPLIGKRGGQFAIDIDGRKSSYRLIASFDDISSKDVFSQANKINIIRIEEVSKHYE